MRRGPRALWLVRHGQSTGNLAREAAYRDELHEIALPARDADIPLSPHGEAQAAAFGHWLGGRPAEQRPTFVLTSPFLRARETARLALDAAGGGLRDLPVDVDERLRDRELGILEGLTWRGIAAKFPEEAERKARQGRFYHRPPGGESWADITLRLRSVYADMARELADERVLVVAHDAVIMLTRVIVEGIDEAAITRISDDTEYANAALTAYEHGAGGLELTAFNAVVAPVPVTAGEP
jgi:broad specificity phosphatase PhoE